MAATATLSASASARRSSLMRYFRHPGFLIGVILLTLLLIVAVAAPWIAPMSPLETDLANTLAPPSAAHLLGTDQFGRDVLSRLIWGTRISLQVAVAVMALSLSLGMVIGAVAGFFGGWVERVTVSIIDILLAFPGFLLALALVAARGSSLESVIIAVALAFTPRVAAVMRAVVLTIKPRTYVEASRAIGMGTMRLLFLHVVPNSLPPVIVVATVSAATAILAEAGLSFLGLGVQPPAPTWGNVIADGQSFLASNPLISLSAGICIAVMVVALNLLGDGLRDTLDPQMRRSSGRVL
ncbi:peptide ABC transporter permease (plasmid) [Azospirillum argentinense]|uniref:ABC transporter permease n=4 Tax=Azospirillum TaxID=191 RepID=A0A060DS08_9PROT|nr:MULTISPECIES: ABC transporter permease [Azospirillum]AIB15475.1 peptide ABC transporter permease [Azospirillum argentinense]EZQ04259.1 glutathione ABC transporter permease [Azospirillum argentinense]MBK3803187.1 ABC transporter permease subunit [Azospirillum argentinense]PNQ96751.1 ABC transporter permease [Azospirillum argentinense]UKJ77225.1 ABC transporter permease [Azospirillum brasilense]